MTLSQKQSSSGFSTAELVVTLFVALSFILAGQATLQLAIQDSEKTKNLNETHQKIADKLEEIKYDTNSYCSPTPPPADDDLEIICETITPSDDSSFYKITARHKKQTLKETIYVKSH